MAAQAMVHKINPRAIKQMKVRIPETCPGCRADLRAESSIIERGWEPTYRYFQIDPDNPSELYAASEPAIDPEYSEGFTSGYFCTQCGRRVSIPVKK